MKRFFLFSVLSFFWVASFSQADKTPTRKAQFNVDAKSIGIKGYDPVNYFTKGKPAEGKSALSDTYQGITYYFSSAENLALFKKNPAQYEPQYGGWCAYAMGNDGSKVEVDPETFKILNGKLYLFYNKFFTNTLKSWNKNESSLMKNADNNWSKTFK